MTRMPTFDAIVPAPFGAIGISTAGGEVTGVTFLPPGTRARAPAPGNALAVEAARQVAQYLAQPDFHFDLPLAAAGTPFQRRVWQQIAAVASGKVSTYGAIAKRLRSGPRAVGGACGANPYPLVTPCHRVVAASGAIGGFGGFSGRAEAGFLLDVKRWLLAHEGVGERR